MCFVGFFAFALEIGDFQHPLEQFGKADAVNFTFVEFLAKSLVERHSNIFVVGPMDGHIVKILKRHFFNVLMRQCVNVLIGQLSHYLISTSAHLMFVSDDSALVGDGDGDFGGIVEDNTLATKAAFKARVDGTVNEILFFV